jgi:hypothetical protein
MMCHSSCFIKWYTNISYICFHVQHVPMLLLRVVSHSCTNHRIYYSMVCANYRLKNKNELKLKHKTNNFKILSQHLQY